MTLGQRFARFVTNVVVRLPWLWPLFRRPLTAMFDRIAPSWAAMRAQDAMEPLTAAADRLAERPQRVLDIGTGTGLAAVVLARRFPEAEVLGIDVAPRMIEEARRQLAPDVADRVRFEVADAARMAETETYDLVVLANMIPFFDELERLVAPGGRAVFTFSRGPETPIYVPSERLRAELERRGFGAFEELKAGSGTALIARRKEMLEF
jgi:ubiquinone/menaquinone biosynthesis C-methylase UbiE